MTIDEAIKHAKDVAISKRGAACYDCADEHEQLAEWLEELVELRKKYIRDLLDKKIEPINTKKGVEVYWKVLEQESCVKCKTKTEWRLQIPSGAIGAVCPTCNFHRGE